MTNSSPAAGIPAADTYLRWREVGSGWRAPADQRTLERERLAGNEPIDPNEQDVWRSCDAHAQAALHRHGKGKVSATRLTSAAIAALIDGQALADRDAGLDWTTSRSR